VRAPPLPSQPPTPPPPRQPGHHGDLALVGRETSTGLTRLHKQTPKKNSFGGNKSNCAYRFLCTGHFHGATERCDWLIVSQQGDSPIDLLMASKTDNFPLFARPRRKVAGLTPRQCSNLSKIVARFCKKSRLTVRSLPSTRDFAPGQMTGYVFPGFGIEVELTW